MKDIKGYEGLYSVTEDGQVWSIGAKCWLKGEYSKEGYKRVSLSKDGLRKKFFIHRLVWTAFNGDIPKGLVINHLDQNRENNCLSNLEVITQRENLNYGDRKAKVRSRVLHKGKNITFKDEAGKSYTFTSFSQAHDTLCPNNCNKYFHSRFSRRKNGVFTLNGKRYFYD